MCSRRLDMKPLSVPAMATERGGGGGKKKLQHISGIFQLMMCGCGSTGEREPLTVLSLFRSPRAPCCIPVHCTYFGNIRSAPFFSCFTVWFARCSCTFPSSRAARLSPAQTGSLDSSPLLLISFLGLEWLHCSGLELSPLQNKRRRESEGGVK